MRDYTNGLTINPMDKIHYLPTEGTTGFWGLRGVRMKPRECPGRGFCSCDDPPVKRCEVLAWEDDLESCKSNKLEIVNPKEIDIRHSTTPEGVYYYIEYKNPKILKPGDIFDLPIGYQFKEEERFIPKPYKKLFSQTPVEAKIESVKVLRLVKTETKDLLTFECKDENCPHCNFEREFSQPEPEESQTVLVDKLIKMVEATAPDYLKQSIMQSFTIQRKKQ